MTDALARAFGTLLVSVLLFAAPEASTAEASTPKTCAKLHGSDLAAGRVIRVVRLGLPATAPRGPNSGVEQRGGLFGCKLPNGPVHLLATAGRSYFKGQRNTPVESATVKVGTSAGQFATIVETDDTLMGEAFLTERVVNAATGRRLYSYLKTSDSAQPSLAAPLRTFLSPTGALVGLFPYVDADGSQATDKLIAFVSSHGQVLDTVADGAIGVTSIALSENTVMWTDAGTAKSATIAPIAAVAAG